MPLLGIPAPCCSQHTCVWLRLQQDYKPTIIQFAHNYLTTQKEDVFFKEKVPAFLLMGCLLLTPQFVYCLEDLTSLGAISSNIFRNSRQSTKQKIILDVLLPEGRHMSSCSVSGGCGYAPSLNFVSHFLSVFLCLARIAVKI